MNKVWRQLFKHTKEILVATTGGVAAAAIYDIVQVIYSNKLPSWTKTFFLIVAFVAVQVALLRSVFTMAQAKARRLVELEILSRLRRNHGFHCFSHYVRDLIVMLLPQNRRYGRLPPKLVGTHLHELGVLSQIMIDLFSIGLAPGTKLWVGIRELRADGNYHTFLRTGNFHISRETFTEALSPDSPIVKALRAAYGIEKRDCVIWTAVGRPEWQAMPNDRLGENKSVLLSAVFSKTWNGERFGQPILTWILSVNASEPGLFNDLESKELMKAFNDQLSIIVNVISRL